MNQRLINCDFLNVGGFVDNLSNKAKLLYFSFITNADDMGFVGNGTTVASNLDRCEENFDNVLFSYTYKDALKELVNRGYVYEFNDKHENKTYLIRHWFFHNKYQKYLRTNYISFLAMVDLINNEYVLKETHIKESKVKQNKLKQNKLNNLNESSSSLNIDSNDDTNNDWEKDWDKFMSEINQKEN